MHDEQPTAPAIPYGYCHCGCGAKTTICPGTDRPAGHIKGEPHRFLLGHHLPTPAFLDAKRRNEALWVERGVPYGLCLCGCGETTRVADKTDYGTSGRGRRVKGEPTRYINGHGNRKAVRWLPEDRGYDTPCHIWQLRINDAGYGHTYYNGRYTGAHRAAWIEAVGPIPPGLFACHHCDVPACVNVDHLFLGTPADNMDDKMAKGRGWAPKLTSDSAEAIRRAVAAGRSQVAVAADFGVSQGLVSAIHLGKVWKAGR